MDLGAGAEGGGIARGSPTSGAECCDASACVVDVVSYCADVVSLGACGAVPIGGDCTGRDLAGAEVGETGGENVRSDKLSGAEGCKVCTQAVAVDLDGV